MDQQRLAELEKLAGLKLESSQREKFLTELQALEELASRLPALGSKGTVESPSQSTEELNDNLSPMVKRVANKILYCVIKHVNTAAKEQGSHEAAKIVQQIVKHAEQIAMEKKPTEEGSS